MAVRPEVVSGPGIPAPIGPYSQAVRAGKLLFVSGQAGIDPATGRAAGATFLEQGTQAFKNLKTVLVAGGSSLDLVVHTTVLISDFAVFAELNQLFAAAFPSNPPARLTIQNTLPGGLLLSIGCVAMLA
jgi:2-iminobutanoate/2-iminopropanoate deaminase